MERLTWRKLQALIPQVREPDKQIVLWCEDEDFGADAHTYGKHLKSCLDAFILEDNEFDQEMTWKQLNEFISKEVENLDDEVTVILGQSRFYVNELKDDALFALEDYYVVNPPGSKKKG